MQPVIAAPHRLTRRAAVRKNAATPTILPAPRSSACAANDESPRAPEAAACAGSARAPERAARRHGPPPASGRCRRRSWSRRPPRDDRRAATGRLRAARIDDPRARRRRPKFRRRPSPPLDLRAEVAAGRRSRSTNVAEDMLSAAKSMFHAVLPK